jgi:proteasome lid subunit RPN8/RPN11
LNNLQITQYAVDRAFTYARLVCEVSKAENECIGYLITPKDKRDRIVRDVYLPKEQDISSAFVELSAQDVIKAGREIDEMGYRVLGWWHSHAGFNTFHSGTDERNQLSVLNAIAPINYITKINEKIIGNGSLEVKVEDGRLVIFDRRNKTVKYEIEVDNATGLAIAGMRIKEEERIGFAYSLVVHNTGGKPKSEYVIKKEKVLEEAKTTQAVPKAAALLPAATEVVPPATPAKAEDETTKHTCEAASQGLLPFEGFISGGIARVERWFGSSDSPAMSDEEREIRKGLETRERHPYAEIATRSFCTGCRDVSDKSIKVELKIDPETKILDEEVMRKEVEERIKKRSFFSSFGWASDKSIGKGFHRSYGGSRGYLPSRNYAESKQGFSPVGSDEDDWGASEGFGGGSVVNPDVDLPREVHGGYFYKQTPVAPKKKKRHGKIIEEKKTKPVNEEKKDGKKNGGKNGNR